MRRLKIIGGRIVLVDDNCWAALSRFKWTFDGRYAARLKWNGKRNVKIRMHHDIVGKPPMGLVTDHKNNNPLDNRKENLRFVPQWVNAHNTKRRKNKYGHSGVHYHQGKWKAEIKVKGKTKYLGLFISPLRASKAYERAKKDVQPR